MEIDFTTFSMRTEKPAANADWFRIVQAKKGDVAKVYIYDEIGYWGTNAKDFAAILGDIDASEMELHLNTPGGSVFDGLAIGAAIKNHKAKVIGYVDGMAASAGSFILQYCDERYIMRNAMVMIHDAKAYVGGNAAQMRKGADLLDKISDDIADIYAVRSGGVKTKEEWRAIMVAGDEWYDGNEAVEAGLCDSVVDQPDEDQPEEATKNTWSAKEVEAFLNMSPAKLATQAGKISNHHRVEEAPMSGANPQNTQTPPPIPTPPAPAPTPVATVESFPENLRTFASVGTNGAVLDMQKVSDHIAGLETFKTEMIEANRKSFVEQLVKDGKISAEATTVENTEKFALGLSNEMFEQWKATMSATVSNPLFAKHGASVGDQGAPLNGGNSDNVDAEITKLENIVEGLKASGVPQERLEQKESYKKLQALKAQKSAA